MNIDFHRAMKAAFEKQRMDCLIADALKNVQPNTIIVIPEIDRVVRVNDAGIPEVLCAKCMAREITEQVGEVPHYSHQFTDPEIILDWDVGLAWSMIRVRSIDVAPSLVPADYLQDWIDNRSNLTPDHLDHIPVERLADPILIDPNVYIGFENGGRTGPLMRFPVLVDGHHRAARNLRDGRPTFAHLVTEAEHARVCIRKEGFEPELVGWRSLEEARAQDIPLDPKISRAF